MKHEHEYDVVETRKSWLSFFGYRLMSMSTYKKERCDCGATRESGTN